MISCDLVKRRVEIKHLLSPAAAARARARLLAVRPGGEVRRQEGAILTTYLDLPDRRLARRAVERPDDNVKLRLREYFDALGAPASPFVWVEVKAREGAITRKSRFPLLKSRVERLLDG
ncbi:MAG TPA: VTC domain-containing protein, partial [Planctomycetota bacterium]|nr:VTC domain-containing protein [Planctomycetota bacterium]